MNLSQWEECRVSLKKCGAISSLVKFYAADNRSSLYCAVSLALLIGSDESGENVAILATNQSILQSIMDCLSNTTHRTGGTGYGYGVFMLPLILRAVSVLAINDSNKIVLSCSRVISQLVHILRDFNTDNIGGKAGGGGRDVMSAELSVQTLLTLSLSVNDDRELVEVLMPAESGVSDQLKSFINKSLDPLKQISTDSVRDAQLLLSRLSLRDKLLLDKSISRAPNSLNGRKHVMISYCWLESSKPELVKAFCGALRSRGIDVWRDEVCFNI
jgi:hypothetical protein